MTSKEQIYGGDPWGGTSNTRTTLKEGIESLIRNDLDYCTLDKDCGDDCKVCVSGEIIKYLSEQGCVIKADRELPKTEVYPKDLRDDGVGLSNVVDRTIKNLQEAGYVAVESLV